MKTKSKIKDDTMEIFNSINLTFKESRKSIRVFCDDSFEVGKIIRHYPDENFNETFSHQTLGFKSPYKGTRKEAEDSIKVRVVQLVKRYSK